MRKSRKLTLNGTGIFHKMWRGHNREHVLDENTEKLDYLAQLAVSRSEETIEKVHWHSFCLMGNHVHETGSIQFDATAGSFIPGIKQLGNWMRSAHSKFGGGYNSRHNRQGKVAYDRPKTCEIENEASLLKVMFYGDANPVRAGLVSHPSRYPFSTFQFYANGKKSEHTKALTPPKAYMALGKTAKARQKKYRELCDAYLRDAGLINDAVTAEMESPFIGSHTWRHFRRKEINVAQIANRDGP